MGWPKLSKQLDCCSVAKRSLSGKASIRRATLGILSSIVIAGCSLNQWYQPSGEYLQGEGFYSDEVTKREFQDAQRDGKISERGRFSERTGGCFNYTEALVDRNIVAPIVRKNLTDLEADAAERITAMSASELNPFVYWVAGIFGCSYWTIAGNAIEVETKK